MDNNENLNNNNNNNNNIVAVVTRPDSSKIDVIDFHDNSIINETMEDLQNKLQMMINNNNEDSKRLLLKKGLSNRSRLSNSSTSATSASSYFSATINSDIDSPRNSLYHHQPPQIVINDHLNSRKNPSISSSTYSSDLHPMNWDIQQVCQWLCENGFDSEKQNFIDNDVTGDVLLDLNMYTLKELNIMSFGKRVRIMNTITSLREKHLNNDKVNALAFL